MEAGDNYVDYETGGDLGIELRLHFDGPPESVRTERIYARAYATVPMLLSVTRDKPVAAEFFPPLGYDGIGDFFGVMRWTPSKSGEYGVVKLGFAVRSRYVSYAFREENGKCVGLKNRTPSGGRPIWLLDPDLSKYEQMMSALWGLLRKD